MLKTCMQKSIRTPANLVEAGLVTEAEQPSIEQVAAKYSISITPQVMELMQKEGVRQQFLPTTAELNRRSYELNDPIGDLPYSPINGITHRYPDRCLLQPVQVCPVYCRFCFRRESVGRNPALTPAELQACYAYIQQHPAIWEVILSGGDPLILKPKQLSEIINNLAQISHVEILRIHTRIPVVDSVRINDEMLNVLQQFKPLYLVLHINHPDEFSELACATFAKLAEKGIVLLGQTVLLKGINDNIEVLGRLTRKMVKNRIKPYYLHHMDLAPGTSHFRTSIEHGQKLMTALRGDYSGLCQPEYVLDIPGGAGKTPIGPNYLQKTESGYVVTSYTGTEHSYTD